MKNAKKIFTPELPTSRQVIRYLEAKTAENFKEYEDKSHHVIVSIGLACPRHHVNVSIQNETLDWFASVFLRELGIPDAGDTSGSGWNYNDKDYLSISPKSLFDFGKANKEKILEWAEKGGAA